MDNVIRIGTRASQLAMWQATQVAQHLQQKGYKTDLVPVKSEGDIDLSTPLYEMDVQGVFTRYLDAALLNHKVDIAVHSMKDVPTILAKGIVQSAVLKRAAADDLLICKEPAPNLQDHTASFTIATGSVRRKAQWLNRYPNSKVVNLRGNINTRLKKVQENQWTGALFAAAGLERIHLRPENAISLDWMLPAPAQGAIMVVCRESDDAVLKACSHFNDTETALCTTIERDFLKTLLGGCATPISAYAQIQGNDILFKGNILTPDGKEKKEISKQAVKKQAGDLGIQAGKELIADGGQSIIDKMQN